MGKAWTLVSVMVALLLIPCAATAQVDGAEIYKTCAGCHRAAGSGVPGIYPPLASNLPEIVKAEGGRIYLIQVLLFGLQGEITVKQQQYNATMPAFGRLSDEEIAAALNHVLTAWGNDKLLPQDHKPVKPEEIKAQRGKTLTEQQVQLERGKLGLK